jgi:hypothetical protein
MNDLCRSVPYVPEDAAESRRNFMKARMLIQHHTAKRLAGGVVRRATALGVQTETDRAAGYRMAAAGKPPPAIGRMIADARLKEFHVVLVWAVDRFARSLKQLLDMVLVPNRKNKRHLPLAYARGSVLCFQQRTATVRERQNARTYAIRY